MQPFQSIFFKYFVMRSVTHIVWDFDGTLWRNPEIGKQIKDAYLNFARYHFRVHFSEKAFDRLVHRVGTWSAAASELTHIQELKIVAEIEELFDKTAYIRPDPRLVQAVERLTDYRHFILTNSTKRSVEKGLKQIGFKHKRGVHFFPFEKIFSLETTKSLKPDLTAFGVVLDYTQASRFRHLMIGDSYSEDIQPAKEFGFQAVHINTILKLLPNFSTF